MNHERLDLGSDFGPFATEQSDQRPIIGIDLERPNLGSDFGPFATERSDQKTIIEIDLEQLGLEPYLRTNQLRLN